ncbi:MAG TPA: 3-oxoacyl-[acyl-carrier-protein] reductase [Thermotogota bacterium]|nr:3-oxoacyl-[acyl-carrier-protein] reductase [Thermotogota bacterium]HRW92599.1 3-oxoacyl-[acyl-carrier-protein] reductase [Thermotogota bacterium]
MRLEGKVALVTGAGRGIGRNTALLFAKQGAMVAACDVLEEELRSLEEEAKGLPGEVKGFVMDVTNRQQVQEVVGQVKETFGKITTLVNNAGITRDAFLHKMTEEQWDAVINVNLKGTFNVTQAVVPAMKEAGEGSITTTSSVVGVFGNIGQTNYAATKSGVIGMTKSWAKELARFKIRANAVAPGFITTPMTKDLPEKVIKYMVEKTPLQMMGSPDDIAYAFVFLASDEARYITGQVLGVDGGLVI